MFVIGCVTIIGCQSIPFGAGSQAVWKSSWPHQLGGERGAKFHAGLKSQVSTVTWLNLGMILVST